MKIIVLYLQLYDSHFLFQFFCFQIFGDSDEEEAGESQGSGSKKLSYLDEMGMGLRLIHFFIHSVTC